MMRPIPYVAPQRHRRARPHLSYNTHNFTVPQLARNTARHRHNNSGLGHQLLRVARIAASTKSRFGPTHVAVSLSPHAGLDPRPSHFGEGCFHRILQHRWLAKHEAGRPCRPALWNFCHDWRGHCESSSFRCRDNGELIANVPYKAAHMSEEIKGKGYARYLTSIAS